MSNHRRFNTMAARSGIRGTLEGAGVVCRGGRALALGLVGAFLLIVLVAGSALAQAPTRLEITGVDSELFPEITVTYFAQDDEGEAVTATGGLSISEDGTPVESFETGAVQVGIDVAFVLNANDSFNERDGTSTSRRIKVRDALNRFADNYMDEGQSDRVSIIVPPDDESPDGYLLRDAIFVNEVKNAINFYEPDLQADVPLNDMMDQALSTVAEGAAEGRYAAVVLFTDGAQEGDLLDTPALVARAQEVGVTFFAVVLGQRADPEEVENLQPLFEPTAGTYVHMPQAADADALFSRLEAFGFQQQVTYQSQVSGGGEHVVTLSLDGATAEFPFTVQLAPPQVAIRLDNSQPIKRVAADADVPLAEIEPTTQSVVAQVSWPDAPEPRTLQSAALLVNGTPVTTSDNIALGNDGVFELTWDISLLGADTYDLSVRVIDNIGLEAVSEPLPLAIEVQRPAPAESASGEESPTPAEPATNEGAMGLVEENPTLLYIIGGIVAAVGALFVLILVVVLLRRRSGGEPVPAAATPATAPASEPQAYDVEATQIMTPGFVRQDAEAYLEPQENAPEHSGPIYVSSDNVALGRDPKLAEIVFKDKSVSRLHARIMISGGQFRLYDEGSASGTYHNYERVGLTPHTLQDNDDIHLGRVHLRFRKSEGGGSQPAAEDDDATQVFSPGQQPRRAAPVEDDLSTRPYVPHQPGQPGRPSAPPDDDDSDDLSTKPYVPHSPER